MVLLKLLLVKGRCRQTTEAIDDGGVQTCSIKLQLPPPSSTLLLLPPYGGGSGWGRFPSLLGRAGWGRPRVAPLKEGELHSIMFF